MLMSALLTTTSLLVSGTADCSASLSYSGEFECLHVPVYENRADESGREIELHVVILPATGSSVEPDPVFLIMGGPGQSAGDKAGYFASLMAGVRQERDLVLVDLRGTGESNPLDFEIRPEDLLENVENTLPPSMVERELRRLESRADFTQYTTDYAMDDLDDVRAALGYETINLYGASYGTRAALVYLRRHGEHVRTAVLKAVAPIGFVVGQDFAQSAQDSLDRLFAACATDRACRNAYGDVAETFDAWMASLAEAPITVETPNPLGGGRVSVRITPASVAMTIRTMLYAMPSAGLLPGMITRGANGNVDEWARMILDTRRQQLSWIYEGAALAVLGAEDFPRWEPETEASTRDTFLGVEFANDFIDAAAAWPHAELDDSFWEPVRSDVPVLLVSGAFDPVTPPALADEAARHLSNSTHLVFPNGSHGDVAFRPCLERVLTNFYRAGTVDGLDASCVERAQSVRFTVR